MAITSTPTGRGEVMADHDVSAILDKWYLAAVAGAASTVIGILVLAYPEPSLKLVGVFIGIDLLLAGVLLIARMSGAAAIVLGALALIAGVLAIRNPDKSVLLLALAFAIYLLVAGAINVGVALASREHRGVRLVHGVVLLATGIVIIAWPDIGLKTLTLLAGLALILQGIAEVTEAFLLRAAGKALKAT